jgi:hypothetical protein
MIGGARGKKQDRVHLTSSTGELSVAAAQALEEFKSKLLATSTESHAALPPVSMLPEVWTTHKI